MQSQWWRRICLLLIAASYQQILSSRVISNIPCTTTSDCQKRLITPGVSVCSNGQCTNPFEQGCLKVMQVTHGEKNFTRIKRVFEKIRICNSDDYYRTRDTRSCRVPEWKQFFEYGEIRIANSDWSSALVFSWMMQIILTEVLEIPATIENGANYVQGEGSFYNKLNDFVYAAYGESNETSAILEAEKEGVNGDCTNTNNACAHIIPDVSVFDRYVDNSLYGELFFNTIELCIDKR